MGDTGSINRGWYELSRVCVRFVTGLAYRVRYTGTANIPKSGGVLAVANHQSHLDPPIIAAGCARVVNHLARKSLFRFAPFARLIRSYGAIPLDLEGNPLGGMREALKRLRRGEVVLVFPEGSRSPDGQIRPFRPGFCALAIRSKAAILPVAIEGAFNAWPRWRRLPRPTGVVHVHFGPPLYPHEMGKCDEESLRAEVQRRVQQCLEMLRRRPVFARQIAKKSARVARLTQL